MTHNRKLSYMLHHLVELKRNGDETMKCNILYTIKPQYELNLFFRDEKDHDTYVREQLIHRKFLPYYPRSLNILKWKIVKHEYKANQIYIEFEISRKDYIQHLYSKFNTALFDTIPTESTE